MNMSTTPDGVIAGRASLVATCLPACELYSCTRRCGGLRVHAPAWIQDVHHQQAERRRNRHVGEEQREGPARERPEVGQLAELHDATGQRCEDQRDDHEEQHPQEDLAERVEDVGRHPARTVLQSRDVRREQQHDYAGDGAVHQPLQDAVGKLGVGCGRHRIPSRRRKRCRTLSDAPGAGKPTGLIGAPVTRSGRHATAGFGA